MYSKMPTELFFQALDGQLLKKFCRLSGHKNRSSDVGFGNNKDTDQPANLRSPISAFVIRISERSICKITTGENSIF